MYTKTVPAGEFSRFRRHVLRTGGALVSSVFCEDGTRTGGAYRVTYVARVGA